MSAVIQFKADENKKSCAKCREIKSVSEFHKHSKSGLQPRCKACRKEDAKHPVDTRKTVVLTENGRTCLGCGEGKAWDQFAKDVHGYNGKTATCKNCRNIKGRKVYKDNPVVRRIGMKNRPDRLKRHYGVTYEEVVQALASQFGRCANTGCGKEISLDVPNNTSNRAVIDHCHTSGKFRAMLCGKCNLDLGMIESNEIRFLGLMEYKAKHNHKERN